jgi:hypothetical protein
MVSPWKNVNFDWRAHGAASFDVPLVEFSY